MRAAPGARQGRGGGGAAASENKYPTPYRSRKTRLGYKTSTELGLGPLWSPAPQSPAAGGTLPPQCSATLNNQDGGHTRGDAAEYAAAHIRPIMAHSEALFSVEGMSVVVTGAGSGIGLMIAEGLVRGGATVYVCGRKPTAELSERLTTLANGAGRCVSLGPVDVGEEAQCVAAAAKLSGMLENGLDALVNNAGTNWGGELAKYPGAAFDKVLGVNVKGVFMLTRELAPLLEKAARRRGVPSAVVNIGSIDGLRVPKMETYAYSASKAAVHHLTRTMSATLAPRGVTVNAVAPGPFRSKMMKVTLERAQDVIERSCPLGRIGEPDDMVGAVTYLISRAGSYVTGVVIPVDGGIMISSRL